MEKLDLYDRKILYELDINARSSFSTISKKIKLPKETVNYRIKRLVSKNYIKSIYTIVNASLLGYRYYMVFLSLTNTNEEIERKIVDYLKSDNNCFSLASVEGKYHLVFIAAHEKTSMFNKFLESFLNVFAEYVHKKTVHRIVTITKINSKLFYRGDTVKTRMNLIDNANLKLDELDTNILRLLSQNARENVVNIADNLNSEKSKVLYRIRRMQKNGIIVSYNTATYLEKIKYFSVFLCLSLKKSSFNSAIIEFFDKYGTCIFAHNLLGEYDIVLEIYIKNPIEQRDIIKKFKEQFQDHIIDIMILTVYNNYQHNWVPFK